MPKLGKVVDALISAQKLAGLLRRFNENKEALRRPPERPGRDESRDPDLLSDLADFVSDTRVENEISNKRRISIAQFRKELKWLYDMIDSKRFRTTGGRFQVGRFYYMNYKPRHHTQLKLWDAKPIILCLNANYATHYYNKTSKRPNIGILAVNWHFVPMRVRRRILKQLIHDHSGNKIRFKNNQAIDVSVIESLSGVYKALPDYDSLRQYLRAGRYTDKNGNPINAGAFNIQQIPYNNLTEILETPSIYESSFVRGS